MLRCEAIQTLYQLLILKNQIMKKTFLNLRKMGFVLVAASGMLAFSCGGEEAADDATDAIENPGDQLNDALDDAADAKADSTEVSSDGADGAEIDSTEMACDGSCDGADAACDGGDHACDHGE